MATITEIKNAALLKLGVQPVEDFGTSKTNVAKVVNSLYPIYKKNMLSRRRWTFATKRLKIGTFSNVVEDTYKYAFNLPTDLINLNSVYPDKNYINALIGYELRDGKILTNVKEIFIKYIYNAPEDGWSGMFTDFFTVAFASEICFVLTGDKALTQQIHQMAFGSLSDNLKGGLFGVASRVDAQQNPTRHIDSALTLTSRHSGMQYKRYQ